MWRRLRQIAFWEYSEDTPEEVLLRHHRCARWIVTVSLTSTALMISSITEFLACRAGLLRDALFCVLIAATAVGLITALPATVAAGWMPAVERALLAKGVPLPGGRSFNRTIGCNILKIVLGVGALYLLVYFTGRRAGAM